MSTGKRAEPHSEAPAKLASIRRADGPGRWRQVETLVYKLDGDAPFKDITRQVLFSDRALAAELRYFEMAPGGHSTLERHEHVHAVMIHRGHGQCLIGTEVRSVEPGDLVFIPAMVWHQFRAGREQPFGFLCMVNASRDKPQLPTAEELTSLRRHPAVAAFLGS